MAWIKRSSQLKTLAGLLALGLVINSSALVLAQSTSSSASSNLPDQWRDTYIPPDRGNPEGRESGASRGSCIKVDKKDNKLIALVPTSGGGGTVAKYPTFFWYLPPTKPDSTKAIEFRLQDDKGQDIYTTKFAIAPGQQGIMSLRLPASSTMLPLEVGHQYSWQVTLICNPNQRLQGDSDDNVEGLVLRVQKSSSLPNQSDTATLQEQLAFYAKSGLWYETLTTLVELRRLNPNDRALASAWTKLLKSVDLEKIAQEPMPFESAAEGNRFPIQQTNNITKQIEAR